jgi:cysteine desulfurase
MAAYGDAERAHGSIRFTLGENTTKKEIDYTINKLKIIVEKLRKISPLTPLELRS